MLTETEKAYIAGFFDGDGHFTVQLRNHRSKKDPKQYKYFTPCAGFTNTNLELLKWIQEKLQNGNVRVHTKSHKTGNNKICYQLYITRSKLEEFTKLILPYLINKKKQGELILQGIQSHSQKEWVEIRKQIRALNGRSGGYREI